MKETTNFAVDCVIDAVITLTAMDDRKIDENAKMFLRFLGEEKYKGVRDFDAYLDSLATGFAMLAGENPDWRRKVCKEKFWQEYAEEFVQWMATAT